jgi:hypothetical protein
VCELPTQVAGISNGPVGVIGSGCGTLTEIGTKCDFACALGYYKTGEGILACDNANSVYGRWSLAGVATCKLVPCPAGSNGESVLSGCTCKPGFVGKIMGAQGQYPYYTGGCKGSPTPPFNCFKLDKTGCQKNSHVCMWDTDKANSKGACVPECDKHEAGEKCHSLIGCKFVVMDGFGMCEAKETDALIKKHKKEEQVKDKKDASFVLKRCQKTKKTFCRRGSLAVRTCNINGSQREGVSCTRRTGLLEFLYPTSNTGPCATADVHIRSCVTEMEN